MSSGCQIVSDTGNYKGSIKSNIMSRIISSGSVTYIDVN